MDEAGLVERGELIVVGKSPADTLPTSDQVAVSMIETASSKLPATARIEPSGLSAMPEFCEKL